MTKPQQPELRRTGLGSTDQEAAELRAREDQTPPDTGRAGRVPEANRPGHHPPVEQDKPAGPPA
jgi:hypothetical protein